MKTIDIFNLEVNHSLVRKPLIIAEAGVNHEGDMENAKRLIDEASEASADAIKFQTYKAETIASKDSPSYWDRSEEPTESQYKLLKSTINFGRKSLRSLSFTAIKPG
jgi:sialic acid synthase SpsE